MINENVKSAFCEAFDLPEVEVTDDSVLKVMAAICWSYTCTQNDFYPYEVSTKGDLVDSILENATEMAKNDDYVYFKVREIFGVEDEE